MAAIDLPNRNYAASEPAFTAAERALFSSKLDTLLTAWPAGAPTISLHELTSALLDTLTPAQRTAAIAKQPPRGLGVVVRRLLVEARHIEE
jgi:hypothetical protein